MFSWKIPGKNQNGKNDRFSGFLLDVSCWYTGCVWEVCFLVIWLSSGCHLLVIWLSSGMANNHWVKFTCINVNKKVSSKTMIPGELRVVQMIYCWKFQKGEEKLETREFWLSRKPRWIRPGTILEGVALKDRLIICKYIDNISKIIVFFKYF